jgi:hypothetical protein
MLVCPQEGRRAAGIRGTCEPTLLQRGDGGRDRRLFKPSLDSNKGVVTRLRIDLVAPTIFH